jgi:hypothetical protein
MNKIFAVIMFVLSMTCLSGVALAQEVTITVKGSAWDSDSRGFASIGGLSKQQGTKTAARRGARISVDGQPEIFAITREGGLFELTFSTSQPTFRLIVAGDRFPQTITQLYTIPDDGGEMDVGKVNSPRLEGEEHTWPLAMVASALGYATAREMLADNKAVVRFLVFGSGADGAPFTTNDAVITFPGSGLSELDVEPTTTSPFLMRVPQSEYLVPFWMTPQDTFFELGESRHGAYIVIVSFAPDEDVDKDIVIEIEDIVTNELLEPPRPWKFSPKTISVRNGFATEVRYEPDIDQ